MRRYCNFLLAAKLKMKSSKSSSAAFGIGVSAIMFSAESSAVVSVSDAFTPVESTETGLLSEQLMVVNDIMNRNEIKTASTNFFIKLTFQMQNYALILNGNRKKMNFSLLILFSTRIFVILPSVCNKE